MEKHELRELLTNIRDSEYTVPDGINPYELSVEMLNNIGDIDSELRDDLILTNLFKWITEGVLSTEEVSELLVLALDEEHLFHGLGYSNDSVFGRTVTAEVIAFIIYKHRTENFIPKADFLKAFHTFLKFYNEDNDVRGYVENKGWAHGAAHGADALDEFARCSEIGSEELKMILNAIYKKVNVSHYGYIHSEDERMITAVKAILERRMIPLDEIDAWIAQFGKMEKSGAYPEDLVLEFNVSTFLKSLYFRLIDIEEYSQLADRARRVLKEISRFNEC